MHALGLEGLVRSCGDAGALLPAFGDDVLKAGTCGGTTGASAPLAAMYRNGHVDIPLQREGLTRSMLYLCAAGLTTSQSA